MLVSLRIKNLALVDDLTLELSPGYVAITGETGTGKSILIGALNLLLGERADRTLIRSGQDQCLVEGLFDIQQLEPEFHALLADRGLEPCASGQLLLKRSFASTGTNRQFVNGSPTTLQSLAEIGLWLVDLHGPHEHQSLLHPARQLDFLDAYGNFQDLQQQYRLALTEARRLLTAKETLRLDDATYARQLELLRHQVQEIESAQVQADEDQELTRDHHRAANAARLQELGQTALSLIGDADPDTLSLIGALGRTLQELHHLDPGAANLPNLQAQITTLLQDLQQEIHHYVDRVDVDPEQLQRLEERLNLITNLKRKYGPALEDVMAFGRESRRQLEQLESRDAEWEAIQTQLQQLERRLHTLGRELSGQRKRTIPRLAKAVSAQLQSLGFEHSRFDIALQSELAPPNLTDRTPPASGFDRIEFEFSPNPGEPPRPLRSIASSGEMARVMLAIKTVLATQDRIPVLVFDEVDANIGGEIAHTIGEKMLKLGQQRQVLCITHLAPVAARAGSHLVVSKSVVNGRTRTQVRPLSPAERITELARMLGGQTESARQLAASLLKPSADHADCPPSLPRPACPGPAEPRP